MRWRWCPTSYHLSWISTPAPWKPYTGNFWGWPRSAATTKSRICLRGREEWEVARRIVFSDRFRKLPTNFEVHEWAIMREFADSVESERIGEELSNSLHGKGAFRYFKDTLRRHRMESAWFAFRAEALAQIARDWCKQNHVERR